MVISIADRDLSCVTVPEHKSVQCERNPVQVHRVGARPSVTSAALAPRHNEQMSTTLPDSVVEKVLAFPEWRMGAKRIKVVLADGRSFSSVEVAWGRDVVRVAGYEEVPFDAADVVAVEDFSNG